MGIYGHIQRLNYIRFVLISYKKVSRVRFIKNVVCMEIKKKQKVLLTAPDFYDYPEILRSALIDLGFEVVLFLYPKSYLYMPVFPMAKTHFLRKIYSLFRNDFDDFSKYCITHLRSLRFDYLLSINLPVSNRLIQLLKKNIPTMKSILYLWDPLCKFNVLPYASNYDKVYTFDPKDAVDYNLRYKINYWKNTTVSDMRVRKENCDLVFVGKFSKSRADMLVSIIQGNPHLNFFVRLFCKHFQNKNSYRNWFAGKDMVYRKIFSSILIEETMPIEIVNTYILRSRGIIDIELLPQYGISQRVIFALANKKKVITTNPYLLSDKTFADQVLDICNIGNGLEEWLRRPIERYALYDEIQRSEVHQWAIDVLELEETSGRYE